jgi:hypothetical protein
MTSLWAIAALVVAIGVWQAGRVARGWRVWRRLRGDRLVTCPETGRTSAVRIDARHAATSMLLDGTASVRLAQCSRWPSRESCDEACVHEATTTECSVRHIVEKSYESQACVYCGKAIGDVDFLGHEAALLDPDGKTFAWSEVAPERMQETLRTSQKVCWNCHVAETFRRIHPELVTDRGSH